MPSIMTASGTQPLGRVSNTTEGLAKSYLFLSLSVQEALVPLLGFPDSLQIALG